MDVLELSGVERAFTDFALRDISFSLPSGFVTGLIGANGSGKTTLLKALLHLLPIDRGTIRVFGDNYEQHERQIKSRIGFVFDDLHTYNHLTVRESGRMMSWFYPQWTKGSFRRWNRELGIPYDRKIGQLSKGMKIKFGLATALAHDPDLLILDEPTSGLDPVSRREILLILSDWMKVEERSVLFSTHITTDLERIADHLLLVHDGRLQFAGKKDELVDGYALVKGPLHLLDRDIRAEFIGLRETPTDFEGLIRDRERASSLFLGVATLDRPSLDDILFYTKRGGLA